METKYRALATIKFEKLGEVYAGETLTDAQAKRLKKEDKWLLEQGYVEEVTE